jgi:hypothetical protein
MPVPDVPFFADFSDSAWRYYGLILPGAFGDDLPHPLYPQIKFIQLYHPDSQNLIDEIDDPSDLISGLVDDDDFFNVYYHIPWRGFYVRLSLYCDFSLASFLGSAVSVDGTSYGFLQPPAGARFLDTLTVCDAEETTPTQGWREIEPLVLVRQTPPASLPAGSNPPSERPVYARALLSAEGEIKIQLAYSRDAADIFDEVSDDLPPIIEAPFADLQELELAQFTVGGVQCTFSKKTAVGYDDPQFRPGQFNSFFGVYVLDPDDHLLADGLWLHGNKEHIGTLSELPPEAGDYRDFSGLDVSLLNTGLFSGDQFVVRVERGSTYVGDYVKHNTWSEVTVSGGEASGSMTLQADFDRTSWPGEGFPASITMTFSTEAGGGDQANPQVSAQLPAGWMDNRPNLLRLTFPGGLVFDAVDGGELLRLQFAVESILFRGEVCQVGWATIRNPSPQDSYIFGETLLSGDPNPDYVGPAPADLFGYEIAPLHARYDDGALRLTIYFTTEVFDHVFDFDPDLSQAQAWLDLLPMTLANQQPGSLFPDIICSLQETSI